MNSTQPIENGKRLSEKYGLLKFNQCARLTIQYTFELDEEDDSGISGVVLVTLLSPRRSKTEVLLATGLAVVVAAFAGGSLTDGGITLRFSSSTCSTHSGSCADLKESVLDTFSFFGGEGPDLTSAQAIMVKRIF